MTKSDLIWAIREIDQDLIREAEENSPATKRYVRPLRIALIAAAIVVLLSGTVLGVYVGIHWSELMENYFHMDNGDKELMNSSVQTVYATAEQDGCTFRITQLMGDEHCMMAALEIQLPDDLATTPIKADELRSVAEASGHKWEDVQWRLDLSYGYKGEEIIPTAAYAETQLFPVGMSKEELLSAAEEYIMEPPDDFGGYINPIYGAIHDAAMEVYQSNLQSGEWANIGNGTMLRSYDEESNTLSYLVYMYTDHDIQNRPCTLVVTDVLLEDLLATYSQPDKKDYIEQTYDPLLSEPVVLNFNATYTPQGNDYEIYQGDTLIGTMELSPFAAYASFPQEPDDPNRLAPNRTDYLEDADIEVTLTDGSVITYRTRSSGFAETQFCFSFTEEIVDLSMIEKITLHDYTFKQINND